MRATWLLFLTLSVFCYSGVSSASTVEYWKYRSLTTGAWVGGEFSSAKAACDSQYIAPAQSWYWTYTVPVYNGGIAADCLKTFNPSFQTSPASEVFGRADRLTKTCQWGNTGTQCNTSCDAPKQMVNGQCIEPEPDKCLSSAGQQASHSHRMGDFTGAGTVGGYTPPPPVVCDGGCQYASSQQPATRAYRFKNGDPSGVYGDYRYQGNGVSCQGGEEARAQPAPGDPESQTDNECEEKVVNEDGTQWYQKCSSSEKYTDPGDMNCGQFEAGGAYRCEPKAPGPKQTDITTDTETTEKTNSDGSKDTTKTTTTTTTVCSGVNSCSSSTTTNSNTTHTNPDGSKGGESSSCTGSSCKDGDGQSQDDREEEEEPEEEGMSSASNDCQVPPVCQGDVFQCALLRQSWSNRCAMLAEPTSDDLQKMADIKQAGIDDLEEIQADVDGEIGGLMADFNSTVSGSSRQGRCPSDPEFDVLGRRFVMPLSKFCPQLGFLRYVVIAIGYLLAARIMSKAI